MALSEDLAELLNESELAVSALYNGSKTISVILDTQYEEVGVGTRGAESRQLRALAVTSDVSSAAHGDTLKISTTTYHVIGVQLDPPDAGPDMTLLMLEKQ